MQKIHDRPVAKAEMLIRHLMTDIFVTLSIPP